MYCSNCGKRINDDDKFCPYCGHSIASNEIKMNKNTEENNSMVHSNNITDVDAPKPKNEFKRISIIVVVSLVVGFGGIFLYQTLGGNIYSLFHREDTTVDSTSYDNSPEITEAQNEIYEDADSYDYEFKSDLDSASDYSYEASDGSETIDSSNVNDESDQDIFVEYDDYGNLYGMSYNEATTYEGIVANGNTVKWPLFIESGDVYYPLVLCTFNKWDEYVDWIEGYSGDPIYLNQYVRIQEANRGDRIIFFGNASGFKLAKLSNDVVYTSNIYMDPADNGNGFIVNQTRMFWDSDVYYNGWDSYKRDAELRDKNIIKLNGADLTGETNIVKAGVMEQIHHATTASEFIPVEHYIFLFNSPEYPEITYYKDYQEYNDTLNAGCPVRFMNEPFDIDVQVAPEGYCFFDTSSLEPGDYALFVSDEYDKDLSKTNKVVFRVIE